MFYNSLKNKCIYFKRVLKVLKFDLKFLTLQLRYLFLNKVIYSLFNLLMPFHKKGFKRFNWHDRKKRVTKLYLRISLTLKTLVLKRWKTIGSFKKWFKTGFATSFSFSSLFFLGGKRKFSDPIDFHRYNKRSSIIELELK